MDPNEDVDGWERYVEDAYELICQLGINVSVVRKYTLGTIRYNRIYDAYETLAFARNKLMYTNARQWQIAQTKNTRDGEFILARLDSMRDRLKSLGENKLK